MVLESANITEEGLQKLRDRLGTFIRPSFYGMGMYHTEATRDGIRHFCNGVGDLNPLYRDAEYAAKTKFGSIIAPPAFLYSVYWASGRAGGLPGVHGFHSGSDWEWYRPMFVGDRFTVREQFTDLQEKKSQFAGRSIIQSSIATYYNQRGEVVARTRGWQVRAERKAAQEKGKYKLEPYAYSADELAEIEAAVLNEEVRGDVARFWEDVAIGEELTPVVRGPLSSGDMYAFVAGAMGGLAHGVALREAKRHPAFHFRDPKTGASEMIARVHDIVGAAQGAGLPTAYDYGMQRISWVASFLTNWMGDEGMLKRLMVELRRFNYIGDTTWCKGMVVGKEQVNGESLVHIELGTENQRHEVTAIGKAVVALPSKHPAILSPMPF